MDSIQKIKVLLVIFAKKIIQDDTEMGHVAVCANVLVPCQNKCGSYVSRLEMPIHKKMCVNQSKQGTPKINKYQSDMQINNVGTSSLNRKIEGNQEVILNTFKDELTNLSQKLSNYEKRMVSPSKLTNDGTSESIAALQNSCVKQQTELDKLQYQNQIIFEWKKSLELQIDALNQNIQSFQKTTNNNESKLLSIQEQLVMFKAMNNEIGLDLNTIFEEQSHQKHFTNEINDKIEAFKDFYAEESTTIALLWKDHTKDIELLKKDLSGIKLVLDEIKAKITNIVFDCRSFGQIAADAADRIELQERQSDKFKIEINQMKLDMDILENLITSIDITNHTGNFLWKVTEVKSKLERVKETKSVLKSPIFYTDTHGYKIRANKIIDFTLFKWFKKWKERYALISIHVMKGEYDLLLKWPCHIEGSLTLKDLEYTGEPKDFSKHIVAKRQTGNEENEEPQESSASYVFIPHTILFKEKYMKEDTIFLQFNNKNKT